MVGVDAAVISAEVVQHQTGGDFADPEPVGHAMGLSFPLLAQVKKPVAVVSRSDPIPAAGVTEGVQRHSLDAGEELWQVAFRHLRVDESHPLPPTLLYYPANVTEPSPSPMPRTIRRLKTMVAIEADIATTIETPCNPV